MIVEHKMTNDCFPELGRRLRTDEVAKKLGLDRKTVIKYWRKIGGQKLGRNILFFENLIVQALERGALYAISQGYEMDRAGCASRPPEREGISDKAGGEYLGERTKTNTIKRILKTDTHGVFPR